MKEDSWKERSSYFIDCYVTGALLIQKLANTGFVSILCNLAGAERSKAA